MDDLRREYTREKRYKIEEMWECEWWKNFKTNEKKKESYPNFLTKDLSLLILYWEK